MLFAAGLLALALLNSQTCWDGVTLSRESYSGTGEPKLIFLKIGQMIKLSECLSCLRDP